MELTLHSLLKTMTERGGTDLHLTEGAPPRVRIDGRLLPLDLPALAAAETKLLAYSVLTDVQKHRFEEGQQLDFSFGIKGLARYRGNVYQQRGSVAAAYRTIPQKIATLRELGLPAQLEELCRRPRGLILVTGPTGSGKSSSLAAMVDLINREREGHIITVEDPIEYVHQHRRCLVNQREVESDTPSFAAALKAALREDPDVVMVGEMRDRETIETALRIGETGHLTLATLHTNSAAQTIHRVIDVFPARQQGQVRAQLAMSLEAIVCQSLLPRASGRGRVPAVELLTMNGAIRNLVREDKIQQVYGMMQLGTGKTGMQTFNRALCDLYLQRRISLQTALAATSRGDELRTMLQREGASCA